MKHPCKLALFALMTASACVQAAPDDVRRIVNHLRAPHGACAANTPPLVPRAALDAAAARVAAGATLEEALKAEAYRMSEARFITLSGTGLRERLEALLAGRYCAQIGAAGLAEIGVHEGHDQIWLVLAAPFAPKVALTQPQNAGRLLTLVNEARAQPRRCGEQSLGRAGPLRWNETLERAASRHANDMAANNYFSHTGRDHSTSAQRVTRAGYRYQMTGENIAAGQRSPEEAVAGWLKSPTHCVNLMNQRFTEMGVAFAVNATSRLGVYWVQLFGTPR